MRVPDEIQIAVPAEPIRQTGAGHEANRALGGDKRTEFVAFEQIFSLDGGGMASEDGHFVGDTRDDVDVEEGGQLRTASSHVQSCLALTQTL